MDMGISIYLVIMIIGAILLFVVLFMGVGHGGDIHFGDVGHGDVGHGGGADHGGPSAFSLPVILAVVTSFGAFGVLLEQANINALAVPIISMFSAIGIGALTFVGMWRMFKATQTTTRLDYEELIGHHGTVSIPIKEGDEGQIIMTAKGSGRVLVAAVSDEDLERDESVIAIELIGNVMKVKRVGPKKSLEKKESKYKRPEVK
jgi:membrane protein implicated in regulation of membrane protease activity